jgi:hypothetical protein
MAVTSVVSNSHTHIQSFPPEFRAEDSGFRIRAAFFFLKHVDMHFSKQKS